MTVITDFGELVSALANEHPAITAVAVIDKEGQIVASSSNHEASPIQPIAREIVGLFGQAELIERMGGRTPTRRICIQGEKGGFVCLALAPEYRLMLWVDGGDDTADVSVNLAFAVRTAEQATMRFGLMGDETSS